VKSKKRSATKKGRRPPEPVIYFIDRCLGRGVATALGQAGIEVRYHDDCFPEDAKDEVWLPEVGQKGWIVITKDKNIRRTPIELEATIAAKVRLFVLAGAGNKTGAQTAELIIEQRSRIERTARKTPPPFIAGVTQSGVRVYEWSRTSDEE
jgi:hypothetical protein